MLPLKTALPFLVLDLEAALAHLGRGKLAVQLREVTVERWTYDDNADTAYVHFRRPPEDAAQPGEIVSLFDELGVNLETDNQGRLIGIEIQGASAIVSQLEDLDPRLRGDGVISPPSP